MPSFASLGAAALVVACVASPLLRSLVVGMVALVLVVFMLSQVREAHCKEGARGAVAVLLSSTVLLPVVLLLEAAEWTVFRPARQPEADEDHCPKPGQAVAMQEGECACMEGLVRHARQEQQANEFSYRFRTALVQLDAPPSWFSGDHLTVDDARAMAQTDGPVLLLTEPASAGYHQNPISVYFCYNQGSTELRRCIAEVTNTPWAERVVFPFDPSGDTVPKPMHVSPFIDMFRKWRLTASNPLDPAHPDKLVLQGRLDVAVLTEPRAAQGRTFFASVSLRPSRVGPQPFGWHWRFCFMPQRVALRIYWQALKLLVMGVQYCPHPRDDDARAYSQRITTSGLPRTDATRAFVSREWSAPWLCAGQWRTSVDRAPSGGCPVAGRSMSSRTPSAGDEPPSDGDQTPKNKLPWFDGARWHVGF